MNRIIFSETKADLIFAITDIQCTGLCVEVKINVGKDVF